MTVQGLINTLGNLPKDKVVVIVNGDWWENLGQVVEDGSTIKITMSDHNPFED